MWLLCVVEVLTVRLGISWWRLVHSLVRFLATLVALSLMHQPPPAYTVPDAGTHYRFGAQDIGIEIWPKKSTICRICSKKADKFFCHPEVILLFYEKLHDLSHILSSAKRNFPL
jgi:hypothetical protein